MTTVTLTCPKCKRTVPLSEDDIAFFYPRFFCLGCGEKVPFPITPEDALKLAHKIDRDRSVNGKT